MVGSSGPAAGHDDESFGPSVLLTNVLTKFVVYVLEGPWNDDRPFHFFAVIVAFTRRHDCAENASRKTVSERVPSEIYIYIYIYIIYDMYLCMYMYLYAHSRQHTQTHTHTALLRLESLLDLN